MERRLRGALRSFVCHEPVVEAQRSVLFLELEHLQPSPGLLAESLLERVTQPVDQVVPTWGQMAEGFRQCTAEQCGVRSYEALDLAVN
jgi:hypothetical protein